MKIGYVRVSKHEQHEVLQIDALKEAGYEKWFLDTITDSKTECKGLDEALAFLRPGDTLVVWKLNRAGGLLTHLIDLLESLKERGIEFISLTEQIDTTTPGGKLIFHLMGALAEFERDLIRERSNAGLAAARARGRMCGRPRKLKTSGKVALDQQMFHNGSRSVPDICAGDLSRYLVSLCQKDRSTLLAKMGATLQDISQGRFILGMGAGWKEDEYQAYGYNFPSARVRVEQLEEALQIIKALWHQEQVTFQGKHYQVANAYCEPKQEKVKTADLLLVTQNIFQSLFLRKNCSFVVFVINFKYTILWIGISGFKHVIVSILFL